MFPSSVAQVQKKCRKNIQNENTNTFFIYLHLFSKGKYWLMFTEQRSPYLISIGEMDLLFCAVLLVTVLFLFQKAAINNTLISKESLWFYVV